MNSKVMAKFQWAMSSVWPEFDCILHNFTEQYFLEESSVDFFVEHINNKSGIINHVQGLN